MVVFFVKGARNTHLVQLHVSLDLRQDSGTSAHEAVATRSVKARKDNVCRSEKSKFNEILKSIQNIYEAERGC